jgi:hypothetical protein
VHVVTPPPRKAHDIYDGFTKEELEDDLKALEEEEKQAKQAKLDHKIQVVEVFLETPKAPETLVLVLFLIRYVGVVFLRFVFVLLTLLSPLLSPLSSALLFVNPT